MPAERDFGFRIDNHQVGVRANRDDALLRIDTVHPGRILRERAGDRDEIDSTPIHRLVEDQRERVGNLIVDADAAVPEIAALLEARGVGEAVGSDNRERAVLDSAPQTIAIFLKADRRLDFSLAAGVDRVHLGRGGREKVSDRFAHDWQTLGLERSDGIDALRSGDMYWIERASELIGDESVSIYLYALRPLRTALSPRREVIAPPQAPELVDQNPAHERILGVDHRKHRPSGGVDGAAGLVEEGRADALLAHAEALGLRARVAGEKLVRDAALGCYPGDLLDLVERVDHAGDLVVTPAARLATLDRAREKFGQRFAPDQRRGGNRGDAADQAFAGIELEIRGHCIVAELVAAEAQVHVGIEQPRHHDLAFKLDFAPRAAD